MENLTIVKINNFEKYKMFNKTLDKTYGILVNSMEETAVVNFDSNMYGLCVNIAHGDYAIVSPNYWKVINGEVVIHVNGGYVYTGLKIWGERYDKRRKINCKCLYRHSYDRF